MKNKDSQIIRDWTHETLTVEVINSIGERYYFEVEPYATDKLTTRSTASPSDKGFDKNRSVYLECHIPIPVQLKMDL